ncbi:hypothetical protein PN4B1_08620 [Paenibacillus naphthalenovorans]|nr:hypothetical protein PN4B1_08620 [Paenibacillus naphthalenovorans]
MMGLPVDGLSLFFLFFTIFVEKEIMKSYDRTIYTTVLDKGGVFHVQSMAQTPSEASFWFRYN